MQGGLTGVPGRYSCAMSRRLLHLATLVTPRVHAAVFSTLWSRWCMHRRFQQRHRSTNRCVFRCEGQAEDSFEHYCKCPLVHRVARSVLHFSYPNELAFDVWLLNSYWLDVDDMYIYIYKYIYIYINICMCMYNTCTYVYVSVSLKWLFLRHRRL